LPPKLFWHLEKESPQEISIFIIILLVLSVGLSACGEEAIVASGANIVGRGTGGVTDTSFSAQYRRGQIYGTIHVWGDQGEETNYFLIMIITES
jgi:hypothetical protein